MNTEFYIQKIGNTNLFIGNLPKSEADIFKME